MGPNKRRRLSGSENLSRRVEFILYEYCKSYHNLNSFHMQMHNVINKKSEEFMMMPEQTVSSEMNADLWDKALQTSLNNITAGFIPHYKVVQEWVNYTLNAKLIDDGMLTNFFAKLLTFHPPTTTNLQNYYWAILNEKYVFFNCVKNEENNLFWCLIEALISCLENSGSSPDFEKYHVTKTKTDGRILQPEKRFGSVSPKTNVRKIKCERNRNTIKYFDSLPIEDKFNRIFILLNFVYQILEFDFFNRNNLLNNNGPMCFFSDLLWANKSELGAINSSVKKIMKMYSLIERGKCPDRVIHIKFLYLLAEAIRQVDMNQVLLYPFFGKCSNALARDLWLIFVEDLTGSLKSIRSIRPHWLRLLVCSEILSHLIGRICSPELVTVCNILEQLVDGDDNNGIIKNPAAVKVPWESSKDSTYCSPLCELRKREKKQRSSDRRKEQWTEIHWAIIKNHKNCVKKILKDGMKPGKRGKVDVRCKGLMDYTPLMCAVVNNKPDMCRLLLDYGGAELLDDTSVDNKTVFDMCTCRETCAILNSYKKNGNKIQTDRELVMKLCVVMTEAYFIVHRTKDVYGCQKTNDIDTRNENKICFDYSLYEKDVHENIPRMIDVVDCLKCFKNHADILRFLLSV